MIKKSMFYLALSFLSLVLLLFILVPIINLLVGASAPVLLDTVKEREVYNSILLTFRAALVATIASIVLGVPLAYLLARVKFPGKSFVEGIVDLPVIIPHTAAGIALLTVFGDNFLIGKFFGRFGIHFFGNFSGIVLAMMFVSMPLLVNEVKEGFRAIDIRLEKVARTLGASPAQVFFKVAMPLNKHHIFSGSLVMWARGISEFGAVAIMAYHPITTPVLIYERFTSYGLRYSTPVTIVLVAISLLIFIVLRFLNRAAQSAQSED